MPNAKTIFIGSSLEAKAIAKRIADHLKESGNFLPVPWWEAFRLGRYTFEELNRQSRSVDAAIFIATKDDRVWYRGKEGDRPRDNVILEYGLFANRLGLYRSVMVGERGVALPSDMLGLTFQQLDKRNIEGTAEALASHFAKEFKEDRISDARASLRVICHPELATFQIKGDSLPPDWRMRAMYLGTDGARAWLKIAKEQVDKDLERNELSDKISKMLKNYGPEFRTYVSLGPGDAELDDKVALELLSGEPTAQCIPVDVSDGLLWAAVNSLSDRIRIPVGLLADFEENFKFVSQQVREYAKGPYLFGLFGNTFGNLDKLEPDFLGQLKLYLAPEDRFMLDVSIVKDDTAAVVGDVDTSDWSFGKKWFFAHGAARYLDISTAEIVQHFSNLVKVSLTERENPIPGTQLLTVSAGNKAFARVRRYRFDKFKQYLRANDFNVDAELVKCNEPYDVGLFAVQKNAN
jgi:hypothetical protein